MKKIVALIALLLLAASGSAYATELASGEVTPPNATTGFIIYGGVDATASSGATATMIGRLSKGVDLGAMYSTTEYAITTKHTQGTKIYGTAYNSTSMYQMDVEKTTVVTAPGAVDSSAFSAAGWSAM
jgi:hypothetical protein